MNAISYIAGDTLDRYKDTDSNSDIYGTVFPLKCPKGKSRTFFGHLTQVAPSDINRKKT